MAAKLQIRNLGKALGELQALQAIDLAVERGEFISVVGPSGCGKTTFLRIVAGLEPATSGEVLLDGRALRGPGGDRGFVFQNPHAKSTCGCGTSFSVYSLTATGIV